MEDLNYANTMISNARSNDRTMSVKRIIYVDACFPFLS